MKKAILISIVSLFFASQTLQAESFFTAAAAVADVQAGGKVKATVIDKTETKGDALVQNCAGAACANIGGSTTGKISGNLAAARVKGSVEAKVTSSSKSQGEAVTQNCAAAACAQTGAAGGKW